MGVLVGGGITYITQTRLDDRRDKRRQREARLRAYANAWSVKTEVRGCVSWAERWIGDEVTMETLRDAAAPMKAWEANRALFAEVLSPEDWLTVVQVMEDFRAEWLNFLAVLQREPTTLQQRGAFSPTPRLTART